MKDKELSMGKYQHYKGGMYEVIGVASHSETLEKLVVYRHYHSSVLQKTAIRNEAENGTKDELGDLWVRPLAMFSETVEVNGRQVPRFKKL